MDDIAVQPQPDVEMAEAVGQEETTLPIIPGVTVISKIPVRRSKKRSAGQAGIGDVGDDEEVLPAKKRTKRQSTAIEEKEAIARMIIDSDATGLGGDGDGDEDSDAESDDDDDGGGALLPGTAIPVKRLRERVSVVSETAGEQEEIEAMEEVKAFTLGDDGEEGDEDPDAGNAAAVRQLLLSDLAIRQMTTSLVDFEQVHQFLSQITNANSNVHTYINKLKAGLSASSDDKGYYLGNVNADGGHVYIRRLLVVADITKIDVIAKPKGMASTATAATTTGQVDATQFDYSQIIGRLGLQGTLQAPATKRNGPPFMVSALDGPLTSRPTSEGQIALHRLLSGVNGLYEAPTAEVVMPFDMRMARLLAAGYPIVYRSGDTNLLLLEIPAHMFAELQGAETAKGFFTTVVLPRYLEEERKITPEADASSSKAKLKLATENARAMLFNFVDRIPALRKRFTLIARRLSYGGLDFYKKSGFSAVLSHSNYVFVIVRFFQQPDLSGLVLGIPNKTVERENQLLEEYAKQGLDLERAGIYVGDFPFSDNEPPFRFAPRVLLQPFYVDAVDVAEQEIAQEAGIQAKKERKKVRRERIEGESKRDAELRSLYLNQSEMGPRLQQELDAATTKWKRESASVSLAAARAGLTNPYSKVHISGKKDLHRMRQLESYVNAKVEEAINALVEIETTDRTFVPIEIEIGIFDVAAQYSSKPRPADLWELILANIEALERVRRALNPVSATVKRDPSYDELSKLYRQYYFNHLDRLQKRVAIYADFKVMNVFFTHLDSSIRKANIPPQSIEFHTEALAERQVKFFNHLSNNPWMGMEQLRVRMQALEEEFASLGAFGAVDAPAQQPQTAAEKAEDVAEEQMRIAEDAANLRKESKVVRQANLERTWVVEKEDYYKLLSGDSASLTKVAGPPGTQTSKRTLDNINFVEYPIVVAGTGLTLPYKIFIMPTQAFVETMQNIKRIRPVGVVAMGAAQAAMPPGVGEEEEEEEKEMEISLNVGNVPDILQGETRYKQSLAKLTRRLAGLESKAESLAERFASGQEEGNASLLYGQKKAFDREKYALETGIAFLRTSYPLELVEIEKRLGSTADREIALRLEMNNAMRMVQAEEEREAILAGELAEGEILTEKEERRKHRAEKKEALRKRRQAARERKRIEQEIDVIIEGEEQVRPAAGISVNESQTAEEIEAHGNRLAGLVNALGERKMPTQVGNLVSNANLFSDDPARSSDESVLAISTLYYTVFEGIVHRLLQVSGALLQELQTYGAEIANIRLLLTARNFHATPALDELSSGYARIAMTNEKEISTLIEELKRSASYLTTENADVMSRRLAEAQHAAAMFRANTTTLLAAQRYMRMHEKELPKIASPSSAFYWITFKEQMLALQRMKDPLARIAELFRGIIKAAKAYIGADDRTLNVGLEAIDRIVVTELQPIANEPAVFNPIVMDRQVKIFESLQTQGGNVTTILTQAGDLSKLPYHRIATYWKIRTYVNRANLDAQLEYYQMVMQQMSDFLASVESGGDDDTVRAEIVESLKANAKTVLATISQWIEAFQPAFAGDTDKDESAFIAWLNEPNRLVGWLKGAKSSLAAAKLITTWDSASYAKNLRTYAVLEMPHDLFVSKLSTSEANRAALAEYERILQEFNILLRKAAESLTAM